MTHPRWDGTEREARINGVEPDERLRIATSDEPQHWDTAVPNLSPADPGDENLPDGLPVNYPLGSTEGHCDWCSGPLPDGAYKHCSRQCAVEARNDGQNG